MSDSCPDFIECQDKTHQGSRRMVEKSNALALRPFVMAVSRAEVRRYGSGIQYRLLITQSRLVEKLKRQKKTGCEKARWQSAAVPKN